MDKKVIRSTITLVNDRFDDDTNQIVAEGLRTICRVQFGGGAVMPHAEIIIYGLRLDVMHKLMRIRWQDINSMLNTIRIEAGEAGEFSLVYEGNITFAYIDTSNAPDVSLRIRSITAIYEAYKPSPPRGFIGEFSVVHAIENIASDMGYTFTNNGVPESLIMTDVTLGDSDLNKIRKLCRDYEIDLYIENRSITIAPQGAPRDIRVPLITPKTGLIGYPVPTMQGVDFRCLYNPMIRFGGVVRIAESLMQTTNGDWRFFGTTIQLESELPGGMWFIDVRATHNEPNITAISR